MKKIKELAEKYNFKIRILASTVFVTSSVDEWYIEYNGRYYKLHHKNSRNNTDCYHAHNTYNEIEEAFLFISQHDKYKNGEVYKETSSDIIKNLLDQIAENP